MQIDPSIKSRPTYTLPELVATAGLQLFVSESDAEHLLEPLYRQCAESGAQWLVAEPGNAPGTLADSLSGYLQHILNDAPVTTRLYVAGSEGFLWDIRNQALSAGLVDEQIQLAPPISAARRLFCTHCYTLMEGGGSQSSHLHRVWSFVVGTGSFCPSAWCLRRCADQC